jgi:hypothetical protein
MIWGPDSAARQPSASPSCRAHSMGLASSSDVISTVPSLARSRLPLSEGTRSCGIAEIRCLRMLTTGSFPLALAFFSLAFLDRASAKASVLLRATSRRRFAHQNRYRLIQRFWRLFSSMSRRRTLSVWTASRISRSSLLAWMFSWIKSRIRLSLAERQLHTVPNLVGWF